MTGAVAEEVEEEGDAGEEILAGAVLAMLLMLRFSAGLRRLTAEHLADLQKRVMVELAKADLTDRRRAPALADEIDAIVAQAFAKVYAELLRELEGLAWASAQHQTRQINGAVGVPAAMPVERSRLGEAVVVALIAGASLGTWLGKIGGDASFRLRRTVTDASQNRTGMTEVQASVKEAIAQAQRSADAIASSATTAAHAAATEAVVKASDGVTTKGYIWVSVLDSRTSELCRPRSGLRFLSDGTPVGHNRPFKIPPIHPNCRSSLIPWLLAADDLPVALRRQVEASGKAKRLTGRAPKEPSLDEFLKSRTEAEQKDILGKAQWELWRKGKITQSGLLDQSSRPITLAQLRRLLGLD